MIPLPNTRAAFVDNNGRIVPPWNSYLQQFTQAPPNIQAVTVGASPFAYTATEPGNLSVDGGTVSVITLTRGSVTIDVTGTKLIAVAIRDIVTITYSVLPTIKFVPSFGQNTNG